MAGTSSRASREGCLRPSRLVCPLLSFLFPFSVAELILLLLLSALSPKLVDLSRAGSEEETVSAELLSLIIKLQTAFRTSRLPKQQSKPKGKKGWLGAKSKSKSSSRKKEGEFPSQAHVEGQRGTEHHQVRRRRSGLLGSGCCPGFSLAGG